MGTTQQGSPQGQLEGNDYQRQNSSPSSCDSRATTGEVVAARPQMTIGETLASRVFSPKAQGAFLSEPAMAYDERGGRMNLAQLAENYGRKAIGEALQAAFMDLAVFCGGSREPAALMPVAKEIAQLILSNFYGFKPSEVALFIARVKRGDFADVVTFSGVAIMRAWKLFHAQRNEERYAIERARRNSEMRKALTRPDIVTDPRRLEEIARQRANLSR